MQTRLQLLSRNYGLGLLAFVHFFGIWVISYGDRDFFAGFTPLNLILAALLFFGASSKQELPKLGIYALHCIGIGYGVEVLGTQTGIPFGNYAYLHNLGPKLIAVPLLIGVNWFLLAYSSALWAKLWSSSNLVRILIGAALMVGLDFFIEPLCAELGFWQWEGNKIPPQNYLAWFGVAMLMQALFIRLKLQADQALARWYLVLIALFFMMLNILI